MIQDRDWFLSHYIYENRVFLSTPQECVPGRNPNGGIKRFQPADFVGKEELEKLEKIRPKVAKLLEMADLLYFHAKDAICRCARCTYHRTPSWLQKQPEGLAYDVLPTVKLPDE
ncbi:hypothetical protein PHYSODRAFT_293135 [Phytophthora sojae]|uniref:Uncharacterized protein n=1 Tax=Phytophthora sojae (strain P6497) TaxID=1094619 RepID=G4YGS7_PHYSP|nr:hypothetical protein PHYSODRAFT_293135 [Phytophthora sojae]EGZ27036.1 hypothetical protein PHYSODRAFT_293135 [Phytophthora sojae]|eukprot:XP_009514311.1 hypothetical protein PHYSODRAFT_293135 [Phytophthora sojae]